MKKSFLRTLGALAKLVGIVVLAIGIHPPVIEADYDVPTPSDIDQMEILWLARATFSETKNREAQYLVAWTIRNRVETEYRGSTYKEVVLASNQYSGLHPRDAQYQLNMLLDYNHKDSAHPSWASALDVANDVYFADASDRPFPKTVRHFYSPGVVKTPSWAMGKKPVLALANPNFAFYNNVK